MNVLWFLPILSVMMFVHELGHFVTARLFGITVLEFGFGLPRREDQKCSLTPIRSEASIRF